MNFLQEIGTRIRMLRKQCGLSQDDLARLQDTHLAQV